jgi:hypothetical protein
VPGRLQELDRGIGSSTNESQNDIDRSFFDNGSSLALGTMPSLWLTTFNRFMTRQLNTGQHMTPVMQKDF